MPQEPAVISYTVSAVATSKVSASLTSLLHSYWSSPSAWVVQLLSLAAIVGFTMILWTKVLRFPVPTGAPATGQMQATRQAQAAEQTQSKA